MGGAGTTHFDAEGGGAQIYFSTSIGGGLKYFPTRHLGFRLEARGYGTFVGGSGAFGGARAKLSADVWLQGELLAGLVLAF